MNIEKHKYAAYFNFEGKHTQESIKSLIGLKQIFLEEIDFSLDKVYKGYVVSGVLIEMPIPMSAAHSILEDERGQITTISFYGNMDRDLVRVGQRVSVVNPYMRQAVDGTKTISNGRGKERLIVYRGG